MAIHMCLSGGLGNQLHQCAAGVAMAGSLETDLFLDLRTLNLGSNPKRNLELDKLELGKFNFGFNYDGKRMVSRAVARRISSKLGLSIERFLSIPVSSHKDNSHDPKEQIRNLSKNEVVSGHFVDFEWVDLAKKFGFKPLIRHALISNSTRNAALEISRNDLAIHLRYGDFLNMPTLFPIATDDFISRALSEFSSIDNIWIFTDSQEEVRRRCPELLKRAKKVLSSQQLSGIETFWLLGQFHQVVTGNSTFSTWATFLSPHQEITVVTPTPHLLNGWIDRLPESWIRVPF